MRKHLLQSWDAIFNREIPDPIKKFLDGVKALVTSFHDQTVQDIQLLTSSMILDVLVNQLKARNDQLDSKASDLGARVQEGQREASRKLAPAVKIIMADAYNRVQTVESG